MVPNNQASGLKKVIVLTFALCVLVMFFIYVSWLLGYRGFVLLPFPYLHPLANIIIGQVLFAAHVIFLTGVVLKEYTLKIFKYASPLVISNLVALYVYIPIDIITSLVPVLWLISLSIYLKRFKSTIKQLCVWVPLILIFQYVLLQTRMDCFTIGYNGIGVYFSLVLAVDMLIFYTVIYILGGVKHYELAFQSGWKSCNKYLLYSEDFQYPEHDQEDCVAIEEFNNLIGWRKVSAVVLLFGFQGLQWLLILAVCRIGNVFWEGLIISTSFLVHGIVVKKRWHSDSVLCCTIMGAALFYTTARLGPPLQITQLTPVVLGLLLVFAMYKVAVYTGEYKQLKKYVDELSKFKLTKLCNADTMKEIALKKGLTDKEIELLDWRYCKNASWASMEVKFKYPYGSQSSIRKFLKIAENKFNSAP